MHSDTPQPPDTAGSATPPASAEFPDDHLVEANLRLLIDSVRDYGIFLLDQQGNITTWNQGAERIKGYSAEEVIGKNFSIFYTPEDRQRNHPQHELAIAEREGRYEEEGWRVRKDGTHFWANVVITRLVSPGGRTLGYGKVTRDLTERKAAEERLRISEEQARSVHQNVKDYAILSLNPDGIITSWNDGARNIKGYEASEIIGQSFKKFYTEEDILMGKCEYELKEAAMTGRFEDEGWRVRKDGTRFWASIVLTALYDKTGKLRGYSKVTRDMTERKRGEDRLRMANEGLERRVEERTAALSASNEALRNEVEVRSRIEKELQSAVRARDEFLSIASHELRTPVTPLRLQLQGISLHLRRGTLATLAPERLEKMANSLDRSLGRLSKLIDSLLDVARINAGKIEIHPEPLDAAEVVRDTVSRYRDQAHDQGIKVGVTAPESLMGCLDRTRLEQIVSNLVVNAIKYGNKKPVAIIVKELRGNLVIKVKDSGIGISPEDLPRIFNRFEQLGKSPGSSGLGLGLYITKQIVDAQGGMITVESSVDKGSTFIVELPLQQKEHTNGDGD